MKTLKHLFLLFTIHCALITQALAQAPQAINYQAVARNSSGQFVAETSIGGKFVVRSNSQSGTIVYEETFSTTTNAFGVFTAKIGQGSPVAGNFGNIQWENYPTFLEVWLDINGGTNYQILSQSQFISVPYALAAQHVSDASTINLNDLGNVDGTPVNGQVLQWNGSAWVPSTVNAGINGVDGRTVLNGTGTPSAGLGLVGDFYLNTSNFQIFGPKTAGGWGTGTSLIGSQGPAGPQGQAGATGAQGPAGPQGAQGQTGATGSTGPQGQTGPAGPQGATGAQGPAGAAGRTVLNGTSNPGSGLGTVGDFYINTSTNQLFGPKTAGGWGNGISLVGPAGATGANGATGPQGPAGAQGQTGATGPQGATGPAGAAGTNGTNGKTVLNGATTPALALGTVGDFYINTATNQLFGPKTAGGWGNGVSLVGPAGATGATGPQGQTGAAGATGPQGPIGLTGAAGAAGTNGTNGTNGKTVLNGTTTPALAIGTVGDFYINTATNQLFGPKTASSWGTGVSLVGPAGAAGATGPQGPAGPGSANGTTNYVSKFTNATTVGNSSLFDNGNVGIGTTTPASKLHVRSTLIGENEIARFESSSDTYMSIFEGGTYRGYFGSYSSLNPADVDIGTGQGNFAGNLQFATQATNRMTISPAGNVGIGTVTPTNAQLHVVSTLANAGLFETNVASATGAAVNGTNTVTGTIDGVGVRGSAIAANEGWGIGGRFEGNFMGAKGEAVTTTTNPAIGLRGEASGAGGLRYGVIGAANGGSTNYGLYCTGNGAYTGTWTQVSDRKFKTNIRDMSGALSRIMQVSAKTYDMRIDEFPSLNLAKGTQFGFVAQELETVFPELVEDGAAPGVNREDVINYKGVNYIGMVPVLTKAIQEQQTLINELKKRIEMLEGGATNK